VRNRHTGEGYSGGLGGGRAAGISRFRTEFKPEPVHSETR
jgi:hypothetical protein